VDMGYGMKWATTNIGASSPEESGDFFAWGETAPKTSYKRNTYFDPNYQIYRWQDGPTLKRTLKLKREDDAAYVLWGDDWRMPNYEECAMLVDQNKFTWTWDDAKKGYTVTSKQTGNSIFLPAAGQKEEETVYKAGTIGYFWASSTRTSDGRYLDTDASMVAFSQNTIRMSTQWRFLGYPIRPIRVNKVNGHEYIDLGNGLGWAVENLGTDDSHPTGRADTFANGDPATAKWGAPWRTATKAEWEWVLNTDNCKREKSADYETAGLWFINKGSLTSSVTPVPDRAIFLPKTKDGYFLYWTSSRNADGKLLYISVTDSYIKYITSEDTKYQFSRPVFSLSELK